MKNNKNWKKFIIIMISLSIISFIIIWTIPKTYTPLPLKIFLTIFISVVVLFTILISSTGSKSSKYFKYNVSSEKYEGNNIETWDKLKKKYLITSIFGSISSLISVILMITTLYFIASNPNQETIQDVWTSPIFILFIFTIILGVMTFIILWINRFYLNQIFTSREFPKELKLKNIKWFFENKKRFYIFIYLHMSIISGPLAIIMYKEIESKIIKEDVIQNLDQNQI